MAETMADDAKETADGLVNKDPLPAQADDDYQEINQKKEFKIVQGQPDQVCENLEILELVQSRYIHILSNEYRGNASGKIGKAEAMICDCIYDKGSLCLVS
jgi:hypothetical protein